MPSKLAKVQKHVKKKKGAKITSLHENSRDAQRLRRAGNRDDRIQRLTALRGKVNKQWIDRIIFFYDHLPETLHPLLIGEIQSLIDSYISRHDDEIDQLRAERRAGRPPSSRQTLLEQQRDSEKSEYESGFWLPNFQDEETLVKLNDWNGEWSGLGVLRFIRVDNQGVAKESQFPPRGAS